MASCEVCGKTDQVMQTYGVIVGGTPLRLMPFLCQTHGDAFVLRAGFVLATLAKPMAEVFIDHGSK